MNPPSIEVDRTERNPIKSLFVLLKDKNINRIKSKLSKLILSIIENRHNSAADIIQTINNQVDIE